MIRIDVVHWVVYLVLGGLIWFEQAPWWSVILAIAWGDFNWWHLYYVTRATRKNLELQQKLYAMQQLASLQAHQGAEMQVTEPREIDPEKEGWH